MRALKGKKLKNAIEDFEKQLGARGDFVNLLRQRVKQGTPDLPAEQIVKQPPVDVHVLKTEPIAPIRPEHEQAIEATVVGSNAKTWQRIHELEKLNEQLVVRLAPTKKGITPKDAPLLKRKQARNTRLIKAMKEDMGVLDLESQLRANQMADDAIRQGAAETSAEVARRTNLPEQNLIDLDEWMEFSAVNAPMREKGGWSKLAYRDGLMHGVAAPMGIGLLGGGLAMSQADEDKVGAFMSGMMLPIVPAQFWKNLGKKAQGFRTRQLGDVGKFFRKVAVPFRSSVHRISPR